MFWCQHPGVGRPGYCRVSLWEEGAVGTLRCPRWRSLRVGQLPNQSSAGFFQRRGERDKPLLEIPRPWERKRVAAGPVRDNGEKLFPPAKQVEGWERTVVKLTLGGCRQRLAGGK